jgi:hypothetical protein
MEEMCILVDQNDKAIGAETKKNCRYHHMGEYYRSLHPFLAPGMRSKTMRTLQNTVRNEEQESYQYVNRLQSGFERT